MRIATGILLTGLVLLASAVVGIEPTVSFTMGITALVTGAVALAVAMEARDQAAMRGPIFVRAEHHR